MDIGDYTRFILALIFVLALIGVLAAVARRFGLGYRRAGKSGAARRLSIVEVMPVDARRRLVLLRRDESEHLVLLGGSADLLIERGIQAGSASFAETLNAAEGEGA